MTTTDTTALEAVLRRDRAVLVVTLIAVITIAWIWILRAPVFPWGILLNLAHATNLHRSRSLGKWD